MDKQYSTGDYFQYYFLGLQSNCGAQETVTAATKLKDAFSLEEKLWQSVLKSRDIIFPTKIHIVKTMVFAVVMYGCKNWTIKKAECQRINAFGLWSWIRLLRVPWTAKRSNPSIPKEINPEYSLEVLMLTLQYSATWCEDLTLWKRSSGWERLWQEEKRTTEDKMVGWHPWLNWLEFKWTQWDGKRQGSLACCSL